MDELELIKQKINIVDLVSEYLPLKKAEANLKAQEFFHFILTKHVFGKVALEYIKSRGVKDETIEAFGIGYAPNSWESLTKFLLKKGFTTTEIINAGLAVPSRVSCYA